MLQYSAEIGKKKKKNSDKYNIQLIYQNLKPN